jgi:hypothetical protein
MLENFPKITQSKQKGQSGETYVNHFIVNDLNWIFHSIPEENDFGVDAYIEIVVDGNVSGKLLGVQIKHGDSFFIKTNEFGYIFNGEKKHLNYYLNSSLPVIIIILNQEFSKMHWVKFDIEATKPTQNGWEIVIPYSNVLNTGVGNIWVNYVSSIIDYHKEIEANWKINNILKDQNIYLIAIPKSEITQMSYSYVTNFLNRISSTREFMLNARSSIDIFSPEYDSDRREILQIPEINSWMKNSISLIPWFYFLSYSEKCFGITLVFNSVSKRKKVSKNQNGIIVKYGKADTLRFLDIMFNNLNTYTDKNNIPIEVNKEISNGLFDFFKKNYFFEK